MGEQMSRPLAGAHTILVVDDDPSTLLLCSRKLQAEGFTVLQASGSSEALKLCAEHKGQIHLLLADLLLPPPALQMAATKNEFPRTHGQELVHRVVALKPETRVLLISAYTDGELKEQGIRKNGLPFLQKPFTPEALLQTVRQTLAGPPVVLPKGNTDQEGKDVEWFD
jgi:CheY-like chemotaxis protein